MSVSREMPVPPPMRIAIKGWFQERDLTLSEAEAYHLKQAAKLAGSPFVSHQKKQAEHLEEARRNREWNEHRLSEHLAQQLEKCERRGN